ncbi:MAG TPA: hypothetical protein VL202_01400 [Pararhizobium sp.]|uniref:hypothetical protein n=1 Tax=Pararhizobium sp. TaxID=1977563 RepID=UPI002BEB3D3F|nr:hypothetical protein [Pararhizobium sp.]HTO29826.1 hypothetical protein [Pararhizobium sp.]
MKKLDDAYLFCGLLWVTFGMAFGIWMGITEQLNFANSHAHANLVGFVVSMLFGLLHRAYPALRASRLAVPQFLVYEIGAVLLVAGKIVVDQAGDPTLVKIGSMVVLIGTIGMLCLFALRRNA